MTGALFHAGAIVTLLSAADISVAKMVTAGELARTPHSKYRGLFAEGNRFQYVKFPVKMTGGVGV
jgi:crotonobetainyl-CoA:carnitine CoA-transferase CaiB-like acyl-CoA transferase